MLLQFYDIFKSTQVNQRGKKMCFVIPLTLMMQKAHSLATNHLKNINRHGVAIESEGMSNMLCPIQN